jgi:proteasome lid subunit RPN8/RPN11
MEKTVQIIRNYYNIYATPEAHKTMQLYTSLCETEIGWMFSVKEIKKKTFLIEKCYLLEQEVNSATTELDPKSLLALWETLSEEEKQNIKGWGHSHVNMSPTPSSQDQSQMHYFADQNDWFIRIITNQKNEWTVDFFDFVNGLKVSVDELEIYHPELDLLHETIKKEIEEKVKEKSVKPYNTPIYSSYNRGKTHKSWQRPSQQSLINIPSKLEKELVESFDEMNLSVQYISSIAEVLESPNYYYSI